MFYGLPFSLSIVSYQSLHDDLFVAYMSCMRMFYAYT